MWEVGKGADAGEAPLYTHCLAWRTKEWFEVWMYVYAPFRGQFIQTSSGEFFVIAMMLI